MPKNEASREDRNAKVLKGQDSGPLRFFWTSEPSQA